MKWRCLCALSLLVKFTPEVNFTNWSSDSRSLLRGSADHLWSARSAHVVHKIQYKLIFCASRTSEIFEVLRPLKKLGTTERKGAKSENGKHLAHGKKGCFINTCHESSLHNLYWHLLLNCANGSSLAYLHQKLSVHQEKDCILISLLF